MYSIAGIITSEDKRVQLKKSAERMAWPSTEGFLEVRLKTLGTRYSENGKGLRMEGDNRCD